MTFHFPSLRRATLAVVILSAAIAGASIVLADPASPVTISDVATPTPVASGAQLTHTITIVNTGGAKISNVVMSDQLNGIGGIGVPPQLQIASSRGSCTQSGTLVNCNAGIIEGNGSWTVSIRGVVTAANGTVLNNTVSVTGTKSAQNFTTTNTTSTLVSNGVNLSLPELSINKTGPTSVPVGQAMTYTLTVNNSGLVNATGIRVVDTVPDGVTIDSVSGTSLFTCGFAGQTVTCDGGQVNQGSNATITINATAPAAVGTVTNTAVVDPDNTIAEPNELNNTSALVNTQVVEAAAGPALAINITDSNADISGAGPDPVIPGALLTYKIFVTNNAATRADDVTIVLGTQGLEASSVLVNQIVTNGTVGNSGGCANVSPQARCIVRTLNPGGTILVTVSGYVIGSAGSFMIGTATVTGNIKNKGVTNSDTELTTIMPQYDLTITKADSPDPVCAGSWPGPGYDPGVGAPTGPDYPGGSTCQGGLTYTFVIGNSGIANASNVVVRDPLPAGAIFEPTSVVNVDGGGFGCSYDVPTNVVTCSGGSIPAQSTRTLKFNVVAPQALGQITNTVTVDPNNAIFEADEANNTFSQTTQIATGIDLTVSKHSNHETNFVATKGTLTYTIKVSNIGTQDATNILVRDSLPADTVFRDAVSDSLHGFTCSHSGGVVDCSNGRLQGTASMNYPNLAGKNVDTATITIRVFATAYEQAAMHNEVRVDPLNQIGEANENNNLAVQNTEVKSGGTTSDAFNELTISKVQKTPDPTNTARNAVVTYEIKVGNDGTDPVVGVKVRDTLPAGSEYIEATGTNSFLCQQQAFGIVDCVGGQIGANIPTAAGATITIKAFAPDTPGTYTNQVEVDPDHTIVEGNEFNNNASAQTTVTNGGEGAFNDLTIVKSATETVVPGGTITYTLAVSNVGSDPALNVSVRDVLPAGSTFVSADDTTASPGGFTCSFAAGVVNCINGTLDGASGDPIIGVPANRNITIVVKAPNAIINDYLNQAVIDPDNDIDEGDETNNVSSDTTDIVSTINLSVTKNGPTSSSQGQTTSYNIIVKNNAPGADASAGQLASGVTLIDPLPVGLIPLAVDSGSGNNWLCQVAENPINLIQCVGDLNAEQEVTIKVDVFMTAEGGRSLDNEACVDPDDVFQEFGAGESDNCSTHTTTTNPTRFPDILISKNVDETVSTPGSSLTYTIVAANVGTAPAKGVLTITDELPDHLTFVDAIGGNGWNCDYDNAARKVTCTNPASPDDTFAVGDSAQMTIHVTIDGDATLKINNTAKSETAAAADQTAFECSSPNVCEDENNSVNDQSTVSTSLSGSSIGVDLSIASITDNPDPATRARALTYTIIAQNNGTEATDPLNRPHVRIDVPPNGTTFLSAVGSNGFVCSGPDASHRVDCVGDLPGGGNTIITVSLIVLQGAPDVLNLTATIDPAGAIDELEEGDNSQAEVTTVAPGGTCTLAPCTDLVAAQLFATPDPVDVNGDVEVKFVVVNVGDTPTSLDPSSGGGEPLLYFDVTTNGAKTGSTRAISNPAVTCTDALNNASALLTNCYGNLGPGEGVTITVKFSGVTGTSILATGTADPTLKVLEFVETNNGASKSIAIINP